MSDDMKKSNYGPKGMKLYNPTDNIKRKANNTGDQVEANGHNRNVKSYGSKPGQLSAKQQAALLHSKENIIANSGPVKTLSAEEIERVKGSISPPGMKKDEVVDEAPDGKLEVVQGKETLKKDPRKRWAELKKALDHKKAFITLDDEMGTDDEDEGDESNQDPGVAVSGAQGAPPQAGQPEQGGDGGGEDQGEEPDPQEAGSDDQNASQDDQQEQEVPEPSPEEEGSDTPAPDDQEQAVSPEEGEQGEEQADPDGASPDQQELMEALKNEGYSDQEIAYIVHGHHAPEIDAAKQAKAQATSTMSDLDLQNASQMSEIEREHAKRTMDHEHEHKRRMADLEYENAQKKGKMSDLDENHRQRMLDLEYQHAQKQKQMELDQAKQKKDVEMQNSQASAPDAEGDKASKRELQQIEIQKKKLELKIKEEEMKLELEFKKREHELKLKMMEQQMKEQAKQKSEISGVKHQQRLADAKNPEAAPTATKKPLKKSEDEDES